MATKESPSSSDPDEPGREEFLVQVLNNGQELKCHKYMLAKASPFFCAMLRQNFVETSTNKMKVPEFDLETAKSFLDYIYGDVDPWDEDDSFDFDRLTPELLRMSHMYRVTKLQEHCVDHLGYNIEDSNAVDIWKVAEKIGNEKLKRAALDHFGWKGTELLDVPGFKESLQSPQARESLVIHLAKSFASHEVITVKVEYRWVKDGKQLLRSPKQFDVRLSEEVKTIRYLISDSCLSSKSKRQYRCKMGSLRLPGATSGLHEDREPSSPTT